GGEEKTWRVIALEALAAPTVTVMTPFAGSPKDSRMRPASTPETREGCQAGAWNGGPVVRWSAPSYTPWPVRATFDPTSHSPRPSGPYVNQVTKRISPWCAMFRPHPDSDPAGDAHHRSW